MTTSEFDLARAVWRKSTSSTSGDACVEVADLPGVVAVRDSKDPDGPSLVFSPAQWQAFTDKVKHPAV